MRNIVLKLADLMIQNPDGKANNEHLQKCIGSAVFAMGPEKFLTLVPFSLDENNYTYSNIWLLPILKKCISRASLAYYMEHIMPLAKSFKKASRKVKKSEISQDLLDVSMHENVSTALQMLVNEIHAASNHEQQLLYGHNNMARDVSGNYSSITSSDPNSNKEVSIRSDHYPINPQMEPLWFEKYGAFKNGNILHVNDAQKITAAKTMDQPFIIPNQSDSLHFQDSVEQVNSRSDAQLGSTRHSPMPPSVESDNVCSQLSTPISEPDLHSFSSKKRKSFISGLLSWHKELTQGSEGLRDLSAAELL
ncbi:hypothetical protein KIW84_071022 [Lathyrus oleraceus]|uniref:RRP12 HEAT domain-containing protein n=1 Tax=Pisum sativum TaxID=3888 RepID=A0A9D4VJG8_PEA|nr:hypothetical protein KIW84_071022 [Pisum sativum]